MHHYIIHEDGWGDVWAECEKLGHTWKRQRNMKKNCPEYIPVEDTTTQKYEYHYPASEDDD